MIKPLRLLLLLVPLAGLALSAFANPAEALTIEFEASDLADSGSADLWRYDYTLSDHAFTTGQGFNIFFAVGNYANLIAEPLSSPASLDWNAPLAIQPDAGLPDPGYYDGQAAVDDPSLDLYFRVDFEWLGGGAPGPQSFELYDASFQTIESGTTMPIPEPSTALLVAAGLAGLSARARRPRA